MDDIFKIEKSMPAEFKKDVTEILEGVISLIINSPELPCFLKETKTSS